ncbi:MAG TPA: DUF4147 domain-containing protein [Pyrinomonadaceae bacterium]|nr:DUF4147 domain-containing protein [Pyrinomonadaceae bacterium]
MQRNTELDDLHRAAVEIFESGLQAVDPRKTIRRVVEFDHSTLRICGDDYEVGDRKIYVLAIGKAALTAATGLAEVLHDRIDGALITGPLGQGTPVILPGEPRERYSILTTGPIGQTIRLPLSAASAQRWQAFSGGHPLPTMESLKAGWASFRLLKKANYERAVIIFVVSGGGSAMIEWPLAEQITLEDLRAANSLLITCGASIAEINAVRRTFSAVKGGGLASAAPDADQITLLVSDTNPGDESNIASGPTMLPRSESPSANEVVRRYDLLNRLPESIRQLINTGPTREASESRGLRKPYLLLDNQTAVNAAAIKAGEAGCLVAIADDIVEQPIEEGTPQLIARLKEMIQNRADSAPVCLLSGGEFACPVHGNGLGGRNLETVLRCALEISKQQDAGWRHVVVLSAGTDGIDGNTPAAGGFADETTIERAQARELNPQLHLNESDSFRLLELLDSVLVTGPTGTNVRDLRVLLAV